MKIGIIRERKTPSDSRVPLTPTQCAAINQQYDEIELVVESSPVRAFNDEDYEQAGVTVVKDVQDCDILLGVKEVPQAELIDNKIYFFFSHTIKEQPYNRDLMRAILQKDITLIDYEVLTDEHGRRVIAFGKFAGMVGAHNALYTYGKRTGLYSLPRMAHSFDYSAVREVYDKKSWPVVKIVLTGTGRVAGGAAKVLEDMHIKRVEPQEFLKREFNEAVYTQLDNHHFVAPIDGSAYAESVYFSQPERFKSIFAPYTRVADVMINGIFWDNKAPQFFTADDMKSEDFKIRVIADVTCDIAPVASIPSTLRATTIDKPIFGYDPETQSETTPHKPGVIDMMTIDNLPNELPRDASQSFGEQFIRHVLPAIAGGRWDDGILHRGTIVKSGKLNDGYEYLRSYAGV